MPQFDVLKVNQTHLARVLSEKRNGNLRNEQVVDNATILLFQRWKKYITKQLSERKALTSIVVINTFE